MLPGQCPANAERPGLAPVNSKFCLGCATPLRVELTIVDTKNGVRCRTMSANAVDRAIR